VGRLEKPFQEFLVTFENDDERAEILEKLEHDAVELSHSLLAKDPSLTSHIGCTTPWVINFLTR
jgi:hypothetical protein